MGTPVEIVASRGTIKLCGSTQVGIELFEKGAKTMGVSKGRSTSSENQAVGIRQAWLGSNTVENSIMNVIYCILHSFWPLLAATGLSRQYISIHLKFG